MKMPHKLVEIIRSFLSSRSFLIRIEEEKSTVKKTKAEVLHVYYLTCSLCTLMIFQRSKDLNHTFCRR